MSSCKSIKHLQARSSTNKYVTLWRAVFCLLQADHSQVAAVAAAKDAVSHNMGQRLPDLQHMQQHSDRALYLARRSCLVCDAGAAVG